MAIASNLRTYQLIIPNGAAISAELDIGPNCLVGLGCPAGWTTAALTAKMSFDAFVTSYDYAIAGSVTPGLYLPVAHLDWSGVFSLKLQSGTSGAQVNQGADRTFLVVTRPLTD